MSEAKVKRPVGLFVQPACLHHRYIRHANSSHIFERPERLRAVLLGVAAAVARLEEADENVRRKVEDIFRSATRVGTDGGRGNTSNEFTTGPSDDLSFMLSSLSINASNSAAFNHLTHLDIVRPPTPPVQPGHVLLSHPALQLAHSSPVKSSPSPTNHSTSSPYLKDLFKWASEALGKIKETGNEIPPGLNQSDLYLGPGSILAIEGSIQTVCQAIDRVCEALQSRRTQPSTPPVTFQSNTASSTPLQPSSYFEAQTQSTSSASFNKAFCAIRPPGHHCGQDTPSGFCYVNNVVVGAMHAYLEHDVDRAIIIDFDLHHGNGTQALVMPLNAVSHADDLAMKGDKTAPISMDHEGKRHRGWKGFYGSVHDIYSYPCEDGELDLVKDASISLAGHGQYIENIHLQPYTSESDFYERIYPKYLTLLDKAKVFMTDTRADPERTIVLISAGFDACEYEHQGMQRHDRRVPTSFFSRYTREIVAFADKHTEGKVVSVLEGGYSDRALTSAAMGHFIGLLDQPGEARWWSDVELMNIEKATKKKRTGKIAPFPPELSAFPYLARTHALLAHFEGMTSENPAQSTSATNTPQQGARITLRNRGRPLNGDEESPVGARRATRATPRAKAVISSGGTPVNKRQTKATSPTKPSHPQATDRQVENGKFGEAEDKELLDTRQGDQAAAAEPMLSLYEPAVNPPASTLNASPTASNDPAAAQPVLLGGGPAIVLDESLSEPKIMIRISRHSPPTTAQFGPSALVPHHPHIPQQTVYPSLPTTPQHSLEEERPVYREDSAAITSTDPGSATDAEYASALSGLSEAERCAREKNAGTSGSEGQKMPGNFGR